MVGKVRLFKVSHRAVLQYLGFNDVFLQDAAAAESKPAGPKKGDQLVNVKIGD